MALLKNSIDSTLSLHAEMFPALQVDVGRMVGKIVEATRLYGEHSTVEEVQHSIYSSFTQDTGEYTDWLGKGYSFLCRDDLQRAKQLIREAEANSKVRNGAAELCKCLQHIDTAKESMLANLARIKEILNPKPIERRTAAQIASDTAASVQHGMVVQLTASFTALSEQVLRSMAQAFLGDAQIDYTKEELPKVIATQQVLGSILEPGQ